MPVLEQASTIVGIISTALSVLIALPDAIIKWRQFVSQPANPPPPPRSRLVQLLRRTAIAWPLLAIISFTIYQSSRARSMIQSDRLVTSANRELDDNNYEVARDEFQEAIDLDNTNLAAYVGQGCVFEGLKQYVDAAKAFEEALKHAPNNERIITSIASNYTNAGDVAEADNVKLGYYRRASEAYSALAAKPALKPVTKYQQAVVLSEIWMHGSMNIGDSELHDAVDAFREVGKREQEWSDWAYYNLAKLALKQSELDTVNRAQDISEMQKDMLKAQKLNALNVSDRHVGSIRAYIAIDPDLSAAERQSIIK